MKREVFTSNKVGASGPYSHALDTGDLIFLSGQTGYNQVDWDQKKTSITEQTEQTFINIENILDELDLTFDDVVKVNCYLTTMDYFDQFNEIYATKFNKPYPPRTCIAVYQLPLGADLEIEVVVKK